ncbi:MAG: DUF4348 domain-containing protein [Prevotella sp.]|nr:DUF4348 domain-containing protein [Prevotella sp.]
MKKILPSFFAFLAIVFSCQGNKTGSAENVPADSDSIKDTAACDTMEMLISETPMPKAADELFDDFFFNYAANRKLQLKRTTWPLPVMTNGKMTDIAKNQWKTEHFFMHQGFYTLILNNERDMRAVKDTAVNTARVEKIFLSKHYVRQFVFNRNNGLWMLDSIVNKPLAHSVNASFLSFYHRFATDSTFQCNSVSDIVQFSGPDPDDDFSTMEGVLTPETWPAFAPELPSSTLYNVIYGEPKQGGNQKILVFRGISNGFEMELTFKRTGGKWLLTKLSE